MTSQLIKKIVMAFVLSFFISTTLTPIPYYITLFQLNRKFHNTFTSTESKHTIAYNVDSKYTEKIYIRVRNQIGTIYINDKVKIVNVEQKLTDGSIGFVGKDEIVGLYTQNIIYYDGTEITLEHELAHFFYEKMKDKDRSEMFAQAVEKFYTLIDILRKG